MRRRTLLLGAGALAVTQLFSTRAWALAISGLWVRGPFSGKAYTVKGTLYFRLPGDGTDRALNTYWNGSTTDPARQCPELIKRYARLLGFSGYTGGTLTGDNGNKLPSLGNGDAAASRFASASKQGFSYIGNGSATLPKTGSVISISGYSRDDGKLRIDGGHVGILCNYSPPSSKTTSFSVLLFDQNFPTNVWKEIRFDKRNGKWYGTWTNSSRAHDVIGWATPTG